MIMGGSLTPASQAGSAGSYGFWQRGDASRATAEPETAQLRDQIIALTAELAEAGRVQARQQAGHHEQMSAAAADLADARGRLNRTQTELRAAVGDRTAPRTRAEVLAGGVEQPQRRADALQADLDAARTAAERQHADLTRRAELAEQRYRDLAAAAEQQRATADNRYQELLAALAAGGFAVPPDDVGERPGGTP
ncbi:hypothetical protein GA0070615_2187 [Micromonospora aurantiaca]|nr:hypothetical protein GA0070615_2187 [Micromonospora aurantiaca]